MIKIKKFSRHCPICGFDQGNVLTRISLMCVEGEPLPSEFDVCLCERCCFCFDDIAATQANFDDYYKTTGKYAQANTGGSGGTSDADMKRWNHVIRILSAHLTKDQRIVDVGCGKGGLLLALQAQGYSNVVGIELSSGCREALTKQTIACYKDLADCLAAEAPFDCVICSQVLEHIFSLGGFLKGIGGLIRNKSIIYVEVPNAAGYSDCFHAPFYYFDREHINHFTQRSMDNLISECLHGQQLFSEEAYAEPISGMSTPNLYAVYQPCDEKRAIVPDVLCSRKIESYVSLSAGRDNYPEVEALKGSHAPVLLWGQGAHLRRLLSKGVFLDIPIKGIIDRDKGGHGESFAGYPIFAPQDIQAPRFQGATVIITSVLYANQIHESLLSQSFNGRIIKISE
jgi:2-polyprenyl-3-methyl-5-hydroxy-6-metoxy-1,4-benzoquinol methylase